MRIIRQTVAFLMITVLLFSAVSAEEAGLPRAADAERAVRVLSAIGVIAQEEAEGFLQDTAMTRGAFAVFLVRLLKLQALEYGQAKYLFYDVKEEAPFYTAVSTVAELGLMKGYGEFRFAPEEQITVLEAAKVLLDALGYERYAMANGAYPAGYLLAASQTGLVSGLPGAAIHAPAAKGTVAALAYRSLSVGMMVNKTYGSSPSYVTDRDKTLLGEYHGVYLSKGILTDNAITRLSGESRLQAGKVEVQSVVYETGAQDVSELLGRYVEVYSLYSKEADSYTLLLALPVEKKNTVLALDADSLAHNDPAFTRRNLVYTDERGARVNAALSEVDVIYNGKAVVDYTAQMLMPAEGSVTLLDNDGDGAYDVVFVEWLQTCVVRSTDVLTHTVLGLYGEQLVLDAGDSGRNIGVYDGEGAPALFDNIKPWNVLTIVRSLDERYIRVSIGTDVLTGTIDSIFEQENHTIVTVAGLSYRVSDAYEKAAARGDQNVQTMRVGYTYSLYLDLQGRISAVNAASASGSGYGFLIGARAKGALGDIQFRMLTLEDGMKDYTGAARMRYNGTDTVTPAQLIARPALSNGGVFVPQLIKYKLNDEGQLQGVTTAVTPAQQHGGDALVLHEDAPVTIGSGGSEQGGLRYDSGTIHAKYAIGENTLIFTIPRPVNGVTDYERMYVKKKGTIVGGRVNSGNVAMKIYDVAASTAPGAVVCYEPGMFDRSYNERCAVVTRTSRAMAEDGSIVTQVTALSGANVLTYVMDSEVQGASGLKEGDVIRIASDSSGRIRRFLTLIELSKSDLVPFSDYGGDGNLYPESFTRFGRVMGNDGKIYAISDGSTTRPHTFDNTSYYIYDTAMPAGQRVSRGSSAAILSSGKGYEDGSMVFFYSNYTWVRDVVILK